MNQVPFPTLPTLLVLLLCAVGVASCSEDLPEETGAPLHLEIDKLPKPGQTPRLQNRREGAREAPARPDRRRREARERRRGRIDSIRRQRRAEVRESEVRGPVARRAEDAGLTTSPLSAPPRHHQGINLANVHRGGGGYGSAASARQHRRLRAIGANAIGITPFGFQPGTTATGIAGFSEHVSRPGRPDGDRLRTLAAEIDSAHNAGLSVMLKPHIWSHDFDGGQEWHGTIRQGSPEEHRLWWNSYREFILSYARFSERKGVEVLCIGTELVQMTTSYPEEWRGLIADVRKIYGGKLTYAAHWDREWREITFWDALDYVGIAAYFPLDRPDSASVEDLVEAWDPLRREIGDLSTKVNRRVLFLEVGYRPVAGTWQRPWQYSGGLRDPEAQARGFEALFRAFGNEEWFAGSYIWKAFTDTKGWGRDEEEGFRFLGLPAEDVVRRHWSR